MTVQRAAESIEAEAARRLRDARRTRRPCGPVRGLLRSGDIDQAYRVQELVTRADVEHGRRIVGRKIGLTSEAVQQQLGVDQPDFGVLFADMRCDAGATVDLGRLIQPRVEAEVAFVLEADLDGEPLTDADVRSAIAFAVPALEIVDSRVADWDIEIVDTVADNASSGLYVLSQHETVVADLDLAGVPMRMEVNGETASTGSGRACLGDPLTAVRWLAATCRRLGSPLRAGELVLSGALGPVVTLASGMKIKAHLGELGSVAASFD